MRCILVRPGGEPYHRNDGRYMGGNGGLEERHPDVAERAAMLRRVVVLVFQGEGGELRGGKRTDHEHDEQEFARKMDPSHLRISIPE